jgi:hypothetical protein
MYFPRWIMASAVEERMARSSCLLDLARSSTVLHLASDNIVLLQRISNRINLHQQIGYCNAVMLVYRGTYLISIHLITFDIKSTLHILHSLFP